jgi:hypothetical protein
MGCFRKKVNMQPKKNLAVALPWYTLGVISLCLFLFGSLSHIGGGADNSDASGSGGSSWAGDESDDDSGGWSWFSDGGSSDDSGGWDWGSDSGSDSGSWDSGGWDSGSDSGSWDSGGWDSGGSDSGSW